jgi:hypothetical protein
MERDKLNPVRDETLSGFPENVSLIIFNPEII